MPGTELAAVADSIDALAAVDVAALDGDELKRLVLGIQGVRAKLTAVEARVVARFDESGQWAGDGAYNAANWLVTRTGTSGAAARGLVRFSRLLGSMPVAAVAFDAGEISAAHIRLLGACVGPRTRDLFADHEPLLVDQARRLPADDFAVAVARWLELADPDGPEPADEADTFHLARTLGGRLKGRFDLGPEAAAVVHAAIDEKTQELFHRDKRNRDIDPTDPYLDLAPANRRARALRELIDQGAAAKDNPARRKPALNVFTDPVTFAGGDAGTSAVHDTDLGGHLPLSVLELWRCDCHVARVVLCGDGALLDLGRLQRSASDDQRRGLHARSGGTCEVPGCDRPARWCDAHHIQWWQRDSGPTDIANLALLCRHHHRRIHSGHTSPSR